MVQRSPSQTLRLGSDSRAMTKHQLPFSKPSRVFYPASTTFEHTEQQPVTLGNENKEVIKQEVTDITQELSKPAGVDFRASSLMSSPREISHQMQRRE